MSTQVVAIYHYRNSALGGIFGSKGALNDASGTFGNISSYGGASVVVLEDDTSGRYHIGIALCSNKDGFNRKRGRALATSRAQQAAESGMSVVGPRLEKDYNNHDKQEMLHMVLGLIPLKYVIGNVAAKQEVNNVEIPVPSGIVSATD